MNGIFKFSDLFNEDKINLGDIMLKIIKMDC